MCANNNNISGPKKNSSYDSNTKQEFFAYKYTNKGKGQLHESIVVGHKPQYSKSGGTRVCESQYSSRVGDACE
jgi:hypothetical protein